MSALRTDYLTFLLFKFVNFFADLLYNLEWRFLLFFAIAIGIDGYVFK